MGLSKKFTGFDRYMEKYSNKKRTNSLVEKQTSNNKPSAHTQKTTGSKVANIFEKKS